MKRRTKILWIVISAGVILLGVRATLPSLIRGYVNDTLAGLVNYEGRIDDVDLALWRGAYRIEGLVLDKKDEGTRHDFLEVEALDLSLEWGALAHGRLAGEAILERPHLRLTASGDEEEPSELGEDESWRQTLQELVPFELNRFEVVDGVIQYRGALDATLPELAVEGCSLLATNISNARDSAERLPSRIDAVGTLSDGSTAQLGGRFNMFADSFDMDMEFSCDSIDLTTFNKLLKRYAAIDAKQGVLGIYSEWAVLDHEVDGYFKFVAKDMEVFSLKQDGGNPLSAIWEAFAGLLVFVTENKSKEQFAAKVPFSGSTEDMDTGTWAAVGSLLKNGFVEALTGDVDGTIWIGDAGES